MVNYKVHLLIFAYATYYSARADNRSPAKPIIKSTDEWALPSNMGMPIIKMMHNYIYGEKKDLTKEILETEVKNYNLVQDISFLIKDILDHTDNTPGLTMLNLDLSEIGRYLSKIDAAYQSYLYFNESNMKATDYTMSYWIDETRKIYQGPREYLNEILLKIIPTSSCNKDFFNDIKLLPKLVKYLKSYKMICNKGTSQQQILLIFYKTIMCAMFKVIVILEFCYQKLAENGETNYDSEMNHFMRYVEEKYNLTTKAFKQSMKIASREVARCDPKKHVEGQTYVQLYYVFQKYVVHDSDIDGSDLCTTTCADVENSDWTVCNDNYRKSFHEVTTQQDETSICPQQRTCDGYFYDCEDYFADHDELWICPSALNSTRRYEFMMHGELKYLLSVQSDIKEHYGPEAKKSECNRMMTYDYRMLGPTMNDFFSVCEICLCTCYEHLSPKTQMYINARPAVADANHVIIGARLVQLNNILHIQIEQGIILESGEIDSSSIHWKKIAPIWEPEHVIAIAPDCKDIYLGVTVVPYFRVIVGLSFSKIENGDKSLIVLRTISAMYNYDTGSVRRDFDEQNLQEGDFDEPQSPVFISDSARNKLVNSDVPTKNELPNEPLSDSIRIIEITTSDFKKDLGQTLIPFFDIQEVTVRPAVPLAGIGLYHRGREGYGGFLGIKLITHDYAVHLG